MMVKVAHTEDLLRSLRTYRDARRAFLDALGCPRSNRDPLAEFAERVAAAILRAELAGSRVQRGFDLTTNAGERVQVRYLANPADAWVNGHVVDFRGECDKYALLVVEDLDPKALLVFTRKGLAGVCARLGKRHGEQDLTLQLGQANFRMLIATPQEFAPLGVQVLDLTVLASESAS